MLFRTFRDPAGEHGSSGVDSASLYIWNDYSDNVTETEVHSHFTLKSKHTLIFGSWSDLNSIQREEIYRQFFVYFQCLEFNDAQRSFLTVYLWVSLSSPSVWAISNAGNLTRTPVYWSNRREINKLPDSCHSQLTAYEKLDLFSMLHLTARNETRNKEIKITLGWFQSKIKPVWMSSRCYETRLYVTSLNTSWWSLNVNCSYIPLSKGYLLALA